MNNFAVTLLVFLFLGISQSCRTADSQTRPELDNKPVAETPAAQPKPSVYREMEKKNVKLYGRWDAGEDLPLSYSVDETDGGDRFMVVNENGNVLYQKKAVEVSRIYEIFALRVDTPQLVIEYNEGGTDSFIEMLNYDKGKISELVENSGGANAFGAGAVIQPQFRPDISPAKEPFEILLTGPGLASASGKFTRILRFKDGRYRPVGGFDREKAAACLEPLTER